jgi:hypothetical protein
MVVRNHCIGCPGNGGFRITSYNYIKDIEPTAEHLIMANEIIQLSQNVLSKHRWVDRGWVLAGSALLALVALGSLYLALLP